MRQLLKLLITILFGISDAYSQCPENIGFESGTFTNWEAYSGQIYANGDINVQSTQPELNKHTIESRGIDRFGNFPTVSPSGGKYSVRLGNDLNRSEVQRLSYTFTVPQDLQFNLVLNYAVVFENPNHSQVQQPRFTVTVYNVTDNRLVECPAFNFVASSNLPGFKLVEGRGAGAEIYYKDWSATTIELGAYAGKTVRLEFTVNDCSPGGHFGYAYFDLSESCQNVITGNVICNNQDFVNLQGPKGFEEYKWYNTADMTTPVWDKQSFTISPAPPVGTKYRLEVKARPGLGCPGVFNAVIVKAENSFVFNVQPTMYFCRGTTFDLTSPLVTTGSAADLLPFEYYLDDLGEQYVPNPRAITEPGVFYIKGANAEGCSNMLRIELKFYNDVNFSATDPAPVEYPNKVDLSETHTKDPNYINYYYYSDDKFTQAVTDFRTIGSSGRYYIKAVTENGCEKTASVMVILNPPPPYVISGPTVFTPNSDGINDFFNITIKGLVDFGTLRIYNRAGQLLFQTNKQANPWDGKFNGRTLNAGAYYWLFEGRDQYYHTKIIKTGNVNIIK